jgi:uncharacterized membrane protein
MAAVPSFRLTYIDWLRGLACILMFQTHCYDAWLGGGARNSKFFMWSQILGTFPAPLFLFLAGISLAIVIDKLLQKHASPKQIARKTIRRGAEIFALGLLFRLQEFVIAWGWASRSDLFRVDILNCIGISLMLMGVMCSGVITFGVRGDTGVNARATSAGLETRRYTSLIATAVLAAIAISALTPLLWTTWRPDFLPWQLETYINGVHNMGQPQSWLFPIFPWTAFAFAGLALGFVLMNERAREAGAYAFLFIGCAGLILIFFSKVFDSSRLQIYPVYDYWHTSPEFFMARVGLLFLLVFFAYAWCRWGFGQKRFSPLIQLGQTSLLVYWVHIEFVYGRFTILPRRANSIAQASAGLLIIFLAMLALSSLRTRWRGKLSESLTWRPRRVGPVRS